MCRCDVYIVYILYKKKEIENNYQIKNRIYIHTFKYSNWINRTRLITEGLNNSTTLKLKKKLQKMLCKLEQIRLAIWTKSKWTNRSTRDLFGYLKSLNDNWPLDSSRLLSLNRFLLKKKKECYLKSKIQKMIWWIKFSKFLKFVCSFLDGLFGREIHRLVKMYQNFIAKKCIENILFKKSCKKICKLKIIDMLPLPLLACEKLNVTSSSQSMVACVSCTSNSPSDFSMMVNCSSFASTVSLPLLIVWLVNRPSLIKLAKAICNYIWINENKN